MAANPSVGMFGQSDPNFDPVVEVYRAYLNRAPDAEGYQYYKDLFGSNVSNQDIEHFKNAAAAELGTTAPLKVSENPYFNQMADYYNKIDPMSNLMNQTGTNMQYLEQWYNTPYAGPAGAPVPGSPAVGGTGAPAGTVELPPVQIPGVNYDLPTNTQPFGSQNVMNTLFNIPSTSSPAYDQQIAQSVNNMVGGLQALQGAGRGNEGVYIQNVTDSTAKLNAAQSLANQLGWSLEQATQHMYRMTPDQVKQAYAANYTQDFTPITTAPTYVAPLPEHTVPTASAKTDMASTGDPIRDLYLTQLVREPDTKGYDYWKGLFGDDIDANELATFLSVANVTENK